MADDKSPPKLPQPPPGLKALAYGRRFEELAVVGFPPDPEMKKFNEAAQQRRQQQIELEMEAEWRAHEAQEAEAGRARGGRPPSLSVATEKAAIAMLQHDCPKLSIPKQIGRVKDFIKKRGELPPSDKTIRRRIVGPARGKRH
jgi:hypothetical protein